RGGARRSCARQRRASSQDLRLVAERGRELPCDLLGVAVLQDLASATDRRWLHRENGPGRAGRVNAEGAQGTLGDLFLLRLHDPGERRIARLRFALVHGRERRKRRLPDFVPALDLAPELATVVL